MELIIAPKMIGFLGSFFKGMIYSVSSLSEFYFMLVYEIYILMIVILDMLKFKPFSSPN